MGKHRDTYRTYTTSALKNRADIPSASDISEQTGYIDCTNIKMSAVHDLLSASTYSLYDLCRHASVNQWSCWGPKVRTISGTGFDSTLVNSNPTVCKLGDFAGYNHDAVTPGWQTGGEAAAEADIWINTGTKATVNANIDIGEIDYHTEFGAHGVAMVIWDESDVIAGWGQTELVGVGSNFTLSGQTLDNLTLDKTWSAMGYIVDTYPIAQAEDVESATLCKVPNLTSWTVNIKIKGYTSLWFNGTQITPGPGTQVIGAWSIVNPSLNTVDGTCGLQDIYGGSTGVSGLQVHVQVLDWNDDEQSAGNIYDDTDYAMSPPQSGYGAYTKDLALTEFVDPVRTYSSGMTNCTYGYKFKITTNEYI